MTNDTAVFDIEKVVAEIAPSGVLRAAINFGNPVLARRNETTGEPAGLSVDIARAISGNLGVPLEFKLYERAGHVFEAAKTEAWDVAFLAIDPERTNIVTFTDPYVFIEGVYATFQPDRFTSKSCIDQDGISIAVMNGSATDLHLSREIHNATITRAHSSEEFDRLMQDRAVSIFAGVKERLISAKQKYASLSIVGQPFMSIPQAVCVPCKRTTAAAFLKTFVRGYLSNA